jgi:hypothetical protein
MNSGQLRGVAYARVSTTKDNQKSSPPDQLHYCLETTREAEFAGVEIVAGWEPPADWGLPEGFHAFWDEKTGRKDHHKRSGLMEVYNLAEARKIDLLFVDKRNRVWRDYDEFRSFKKRFPWVTIVPQLGIRVDASDPSTLQAEKDEFYDAEKFSNQLAIVTQRGRKMRTKLGYHTVRVPFGCKEGRVQGIPVKDETRWPWLLRIFELAGQGMADGSIRKLLRENEVRTATGAYVSKSTLERILCSRFYLGEVCFGEEWFPAKHGCRFEAGVWEAAQRHRPGRMGRTVESHIYLFQDLLYTSHFKVTAPASRAGAPLPLYHRHACKGKQRHQYYARADVLDAHGGLEAVPADAEAAKFPRYLDAETLDGQLIGWLIEKASTEIAPQLEALLEGARQESGTLLEREASVRQSLSTLRGQQQQLRAQAAEFMLTGDTELLAAAKQRLDQLAANLRNLEQDQLELASARQRLENHENSDYLSFAEALEAAWRKGQLAEVRAAIRRIVRGVDVRYNQLVVELYPYCLPANADAGTRPLAALTGLEPVFSP